MVKKRITRVFSFILSISLLFCAFYISASAATKTELLAYSQYRYQNVGGYTPANCPYPNGCFVELYDSSSGTYRLYNFERQSNYTFQEDKTNFPFIWWVSSGTLHIQSNQPIYRVASVTNQWTSQNSGSVINELYSTTYSVGNCTIKANFPACKSVDEGGSLYARYVPPSGSGNYILTPMYDESYLAVGYSRDTSNSYNGMYTDIAELLEVCENIYDLTDEDFNYTIDYLAEIEDLITTTNSKLTSVYSTARSIFGDTTSIKNLTITIESELNSVLSHLIAFQNQTHQDLSDIIDRLDKLIDDYDEFDNGEVFGEDESGLGDLTNDVGESSFSGTGINTVVQTIGTGFNVVKVNFEYFCNLLGLNEVIVLLLGFSVICFILGRVVANRMRD